jgi:tetratricopeptide (TPR) repeat protein
MRAIALATLLVVTVAQPGNQTPAVAMLAGALHALLQSSNPPSSRAAADTATDLNSLRQQAIDAFRQADYTRSLSIFRQIIALDPSDIVAYNGSANCSMRLKQYVLAIDYFKHALQLQPDEYHNLSGLMHAYTLARMDPERDELRKHIADLETAGKLPDNFNYVFETFNLGDKTVEVAEFPKIQGRYGERYRFMVFDTTGKQTLCITLESNALDQLSWAKEHPKEAAAGTRLFSLDGYTRDSHSTFAIYDGEPGYDLVREEAKQILAGKKQPISKSTYSSPRPIPGEQ